MKKATIAALLLLSGGQWALGGVVPGRWEKVKSLPSGSYVQVELPNVQWVRGRLVELNERTLIVDAASGDRTELERSRVRRITGPERPRHGFWSGAKTGALAGFGAGMASGLAGGDDGLFDDFTGFGGGLIMGAILIGPGALAGHFYDKAAQKPEVYYLAPGR